MPTCPDGHESSTDDWCDVCGVPMVPVGAAVSGHESSDHHHDSGTELLASPRPSPLMVSCSSCGVLVPAADRFCEHCGFDLSAPAATRGTWIAEVTADQAVFDRLRPDGLTFPTGRPRRVIAVTAGEVVIGRSREGQALQPDIDLSGPLTDPGASHRHAMLTRTDDGGYTVTDLGSTNGTSLNASLDTLEPGRPYRLADGDRVHVGAWTTITLRRLED